jgi:hypothetical protein
MPFTIGGLQKSAGKLLPSQRSSSDLRSLAYQFPVEQKARKTQGKFLAQRHTLARFMFIGNGRHYLDVSFSSLLFNGV